jgi:hypothetical protein
MRNIFIIIFIQLIIISCNQKNEKPYQPKKDEKFSEAVNSCTKIVFLIKKENQFDYSREDSAFVAKEKYAAENKVQIQKFKNSKICLTMQKGQLIVLTQKQII